MIIRTNNIYVLVCHQSMIIVYLVTINKQSFSTTKIRYMTSLSSTSDFWPQISLKLPSQL